MNHFKTLDHKQVFIGDGVVIVQREKGCEIYTAGTAILVAGSFDEVAGEFGYKPPSKPKASKDD